REMIEKDYALKRVVEESLKTGKLTEGQEELNRRLLQIIEEHSDEFAPEDLEALLKATQTAGDALPQKEATVESLHKAIERAQAGATTKGKGQSSGGEGTEGGKESAGPRGTGTGSGKESAGPRGTGTQKGATSKQPSSGVSIPPELTGRLSSQPEEIK